MNGPMLDSNTFLFFQTDHIDYTENGDECQNKCEWFHNSTTFSFYMQCEDEYVDWNLCTPFSGKKNITLIQFHSIFLSPYYHCISDVGYTDNGEECSTNCGLVHGDQYRLNNWCWTVNVSTFWDYCTPINSSKPSNSSKILEFLI